MKICPKCGGIAEWNSYYGRFCCTRTDCNWEGQIPPKDYLPLDEVKPLDGEKIWIHFIGMQDGLPDEFAPYYGKQEQYIQHYNGMIRPCDLPLKYYGVSWIALRPREEGENIPTPTPNNPLSLEDLKNMDGQPVWVRVIDHRNFADPKDDFDGWGMVRKSWVRIWDESRADLVHVDYHFEDYGKEWLAYREKPDYSVFGPQLSADGKPLFEYAIPVIWSVSGTVKVLAPSQEEAYQAARDVPLPDDGEYVDGSFEVNFGTMENPDTGEMMDMRTHIEEGNES